MLNRICKVFVHQIMVCAVVKCTAKVKMVELI